MYYCCTSNTMVSCCCCNVFLADAIGGVLGFVSEEGMSLFVTREAFFYRNTYF